MTPERTRAIQQWWARHPRLDRLIKVMVGIMVGSTILMFAAMIFAGMRGFTQDWPTFQMYYQQASGWSLKVDAPTSPPVTVDTYYSQQGCEEIRAWKMQQAYRSQLAIPSLSCTPQHQGWRRLLYAWQATMATRRATPAPDGR